MLKRDFYADIWRELSTDKSMVFLSGPRQAGKTTLARDIIGPAYPNRLYFNWDVLVNKRLLIKDPVFFEHLNRKDNSVPLVILDEIHKYRHWKNYLKGVYAQFAGQYQFLVSGSGRLDLFQKGGDSLAGRYLQFHLFPLTAAELSDKRRPFDEFMKNPLAGFDLDPSAQARHNWEQLSEFSGFPEPFGKSRKTSWRRWSSTYTRQLVREDILSIQDIRNVDQLEILYSLLPERVGSPISMSSLAGDLQVSFESVKNWLRIFDHFYLTFRISPWTKKLSRAILKEKKLYLFNYPLIDDAPARFENMAALELLRFVTHANEKGLGRLGLHYLRNKDKQEVDFLVTDRNQPFLLVEAKYSQDSPAKELLAFQDVFHVPAVQLVNREGVHKFISHGPDKVLVITAHQWLSSLP